MNFSEDLERRGLADYAVIFTIFTLWGLISGMILAAFVPEQFALAAVFGITLLAMVWTWSRMARARKTWPEPRVSPALFHKIQMVAVGMCALAILATGIGWTLLEWVSLLFDVVLIWFYIVFLFLAVTLRCRPPFSTAWGMGLVMAAGCWSWEHLSFPSF